MPKLESRIASMESKHQISTAFDRGNWAAQLGRICKAARLEHWQLIAEGRWDELPADVLAAFEAYQAVYPDESAHGFGRERWQHFAPELIDVSARTNGTMHQAIKSGANQMVAVGFTMSDTKVEKTYGP